MSLLDDCLAAAEADGLTAGRRIAGFVPTATFFAVALDDGSAGWCFSYAGLPPGEAARRYADLTRRSDDPLLRDRLFPADGADPFVAPVRAALLSALAAPVWRAPARFGFEAHDGVPDALIGGAGRALVIGFGGLMFSLLAQPALRSLHVADLTYPDRRAEMEAVRDAMALARPGTSVTLSDGADGRQRFAEAELVAITGSALANGTMDGLLARVRDGTVVLVQGQSAAVHPAPLFRRGVAAVISPDKPAAMLEAARRDPSGAALAPWVEGGRTGTCLLRAMGTA
jgi:hypothetical protein